jgi:hypothetical protein
VAIVRRPRVFENGSCPPDWVFCPGLVEDNPGLVV